MRKISNIMETSIAGLVSILEFREHSSTQKDSDHPVKPKLDKNENFSSFVLRERKNKLLLLIGISAAIIQLIILKVLFPFPDFISDSYNYIETAALHLNVNLWPVGYAKFLWLVHQINYSDTFLVCIQYLLLLSALLYFYYSIVYLYKPSPTNSSLLFIFLIFNPIFPYLSNCVLSDALFTAITILWITQLIWQINRPRLRHILISSALIGVAFTIRYTAIYYPIIMGIAIFLSRANLRTKIGGSLLPLAFMIPFVQITKEKTKDITGTAEFSVFGGWQIANNALYMYSHIDVDPKQLPQETIALDAMVKEYYKTMPPSFFNFSKFPGTFFIKHQHAPLKRYLTEHYAAEIDSNEFQAWGKVSPIYNTYGTYLIRHYPISFIRYYMLLNVKNYFIPFLEKFESYNIGMDSVWYPAQYWFHYKTASVKIVSKNIQRIVFFPYPTFFLILNIYFAALLSIASFTGRLKKLTPFANKTLWLIFSFLLVNFLFSVFATPIVLRYQVVPLIILFTFTLLLSEFSNKNEKHQNYSLATTPL